MKIKSGTEELIAKYLFGDITEHEKKQLDNHFVSATRHIHRLTHIKHGNISKRNIAKYQSHQFS